MTSIRIALLSAVASVTVCGMPQARSSDTVWRRPAPAPPVTPDVEAPQPLHKGTVYNEGNYCVSFCNDGQRFSTPSAAGQVWTATGCQQHAVTTCSAHGGVARIEVRPDAPR